MNNNNYQDNHLNNDSVEVQELSPEKRHIYYNESALTPPNKKNHGIIIGIFILLIVMLLVGIIGFAWNMEKEMKENGKRKAEKYWRETISMGLNRSKKNKIPTESSEAQEVSENNKRKLLYTDAETKVYVNIPSGYTFLSDGAVYSADNVSGVIYSVTDTGGNVINLSAEYKLSADSEEEYKAVKGRSKEIFREGVKLSKNKDDGRLITYEMPNKTKESCVVVHTTEGQEAVIILTASTDEVVDTEELEDIVKELFYTITYEFDLQMN